MQVVGHHAGIDVQQNYPAFGAQIQPHQIVSNSLRVVNGRFGFLFLLRLFLA